MWSVEHGTDRDDEVNVVLRAGNYGWNPVPGYNENTPMTNYRLPGKQIGARWRSGFPTLATSGAVWVRGAKWGAYNGTLAVCAVCGLISPNMPSSLAVKPECSSNLRTDVGLNPWTW